jgi:hypothetical protein
MGGKRERERRREGEKGERPSEEIEKEVNG